MAFFFLGGFLLAWVYAALSVPATVRSVQVANSFGWIAGMKVATALSIGQGIWVFPVAIGLFHGPLFWQQADTVLRLLGSGMAVWWAMRIKSSGKLERLSLAKTERLQLFRKTFKKAVFMPWRLAFWFVLVFSVGIHLRGPGTIAAVASSLGALSGLWVWYAYFAILAALVGDRVPEEISLRSLNKLRVLAFAAFLGISVLLLAPLLIIGGVSG